MAPQNDPSDADIEQIELLCNLYDFEEGEQPDEDEEDEWDLTCPAEVVRLGGNRFRVALPVSVTPFGPLGPMLNLGDVIEAVPTGDGSYRLQQVIRARQWSRTFSGVEQAAVSDPSIRRILDQLTSWGAAWEWCAANITVQVPHQGDGTEPDARVTTALNDLAEAIQAGGFRMDPANPRPRGSARLGTGRDSRD